MPCQSFILEIWEGNGLDKVSEGVEEAEAAGHDGHGGGLAAGNDQGIAEGELRGGADFGEVKSEFGVGGVGWLGGEDVVGGSAEKVEVLDYTALEGEDANCDVFNHIFLRGSWCSGVVMWEV